MSSAEVVGHIQGLHQDPANATSHSVWLQRFQQAPEAWPIVHDLLTNSNEELVQHFSAHTLVAKLRAGHLPPAGAFGVNGGGVDELVLRYIGRFRSGPSSVRLQLCVALASATLWKPAASDGPWLQNCLSYFDVSQAGAEALPCLLELLGVIPEEAANRKIVVEHARRLAFASNMLLSTGQVLDALWRAAQAQEACRPAVLRACAKWLRLQHASAAVRAGKRADGLYTADIMKQAPLTEHPLLQLAARTIGSIASAHIELCRASADVLSEAQNLFNEVNDRTHPLLLLILQAVVAGAQQLLPMAQAHQESWMPQDTELTQRCTVLGRLVSELGGAFARLLLADVPIPTLGTDASGQANEQLSGLISTLTPPQSPLLAPSNPTAHVWTPALQGVADTAIRLVTLRHMDIARCGLDFWYGVLAQHLGAGGTGEEDEPWDEGSDSAMQPPGALAATNRNPDQEALRREAEKPVLAPYIQQMVEAHWQAVRYPPEPENCDNFEWDEFVRFRETCAINVTEACLVVTARWIIEHVGLKLEQICSKAIEWQDIDACVFVLTGVASRAPAGQDTVIPRLIELLPDLPYPQTGFKALLLRCAASRLVLFTSGYLALNTEPCKRILKFLCFHHLPAVPGLQPGPDPETNKYCEALACDAMKMVMTAAKKGIVTADGGSLWKDVVTAVIALVGDTRFNVDSRAQLVFGIGQVLSVIEDWGELEKMFGHFVVKMQEPLAPILSALPAEPLGARAVKLTRDGKAPPELKLYIAAVSSVYNMPPREGAALQATHHPVLAVVEQHFPMIERICVYHTQYDELMEQVCLAFSYIFGFAKDFAPASPAFVPTLKLMVRCCEQHPQPFYLGLVRSIIGLFASIRDDALDAVLVELVGAFVTPIAQRLSDSPGAMGPSLPPAMNAAGYEMLVEAVRHWNIAMLALRSAPWLPATLDATIAAAPRLAEESLAVHERTVCAMLRFIRNLCAWAADPDPEAVRRGEMPAAGAGSTEVDVLRAAARNALGAEPRLTQIIGSLARLLAAAAATLEPGRGSVVPCVAEVIKQLFAGPFEYQTSTMLPQAMQALPAPLGGAIAPSEQQRLIQQLKMEKGDTRRFIRTLIGLTEQFTVCIKKASFA